METFYNKLLEYIHKHTMLKNLIMIICNYFPYITISLYPCILIYSYIYKSDILISVLLRPFLAFIFVTFFRKIINRPRPYEAMNITPLKQHKKGESFPSRHTLSAFVIAFACLEVNLYLGLFAVIVAVFISLSRILAGVHYISDVITAIIIATVFYFI